MKTLFESVVQFHSLGQNHSTPIFPYFGGITINQLFSGTSGIKVLTRHSQLFYFPRLWKMAQATMIPHFRWVLGLDIDRNMSFYSGVYKNEFL